MAACGCLSIQLTYGSLSLLSCTPARAFVECGIWVAVEANDHFQSDVTVC